MEQTCNASVGKVSVCGLVGRVLDDIYSQGQHQFDLSARSSEL